MEHVIFLGYIKEFSFMNIESSHRTSNGFKYSVYDKEEIVGPFISSFPFSPSYQDAVKIWKCISSRRCEMIDNEDDDCWAESFYNKRKNWTEDMGDLGVCDELNQLLSSKYNVVFRSGNKDCSIDFEKEISPIISSFDLSMKLAIEKYNKDLYGYTERILKLEEEQTIFERNKDLYLLQNCYPKIKEMIDNGKIDPNVKIELFNKYPLDIASFCCDSDSYLTLLESGARCSDKPISINHALECHNAKAVVNVLSLAGDVDFSGFNLYGPIEDIEEVNISSLFKFLSVLNTNDIKNFFSPSPNLIKIGENILGTNDILVLQLLIERKFSYKYQSEINQEFWEIEPTKDNCEIFQCLCMFYKRDDDYGYQDEEEEPNRYKYSIRFESRFACCIKFRFYEYIKRYYTKSSIKSYLCSRYNLFMYHEFKEKYITKQYLGEDFYTYLMNIYNDESIKTK